MNALAPILPVNPDDPAYLGYPATLPIEIAMRSSPLRTICEDYGITRDEWERLRQDPVFIQDVSAAVKALKEDGVSFKLKARLQADALLKTSWTLIHDNATPAPVRADLIKSTVKWAGLEPKAGEGGATGGNALNIQINLG